MNGTIAQAVDALRGSGSLKGLDESGTKQGIVLRLLSLAGWNPFDLSEVTPEFTVGSRRVDYALRLNAVNKVFIEVKRPSEQLENHQKQLLDYCFQQGVKLATLTNGRTWWLYLPLREGNWEQRRFLTIDLEAQDPEVVQSRFTQFLGRESVRADTAVNEAEELIQSQLKSDTLREAIVEAWNEIIQGPEELLVDLISETTKRICGFKPDNGMVEAFIAERMSAIQIPVPITPHEDAAPARPPIARGRTGNSRLTGTKPSSFTFDSQEQAVESWIDILIGLCRSIKGRHSHQFDRVLELRGRKRPYFSRDGAELRVPLRLEFGNLYVERNLSATAVWSLCNDIVRLFGYPITSLSVTTT